MYHLPDQSEKSREPENENGDRSWQTGSREVGLVITSGLQRTWGQFLTLRTSSAWRREHQGQILHGSVRAGLRVRVHVRQVRGGEQPAVLAAGASLHPGAGGHGGVPADLAPCLQLPHPRQGRRLLTTFDCWARPRCEAATCSSEKWRSMFS